MRPAGLAGGAAGAEGRGASGRRRFRKGKGDGKRGGGVLTLRPAEGARRQH